MVELDSAHTEYYRVDVYAENLDPEALTESGYNGTVEGHLDARELSFECESDGNSASVEVKLRKSGRDDLGVYYHNSVDWRFLGTARTIMPGARIINVSKSGGCSVGFIASTQRAQYIVTAGHCGDVGDQFMVGGQFVGAMVESVYEGASDISEGSDYGLIEISRTDLISAPLPMKATRLKGWITAAEAEERGLQICHLGATTGYSCGSFDGHGSDGIFFSRGIFDRGDSGGPVFALDGDEAWAVGVVSRVSDYNKTRGAHMEVAPALQRWGLEIRG